MFCSKISKLGMVELWQNMCPKQPLYYKVMLYSNAMVPWANFEGLNDNLDVFIFEIFTKNV